VWKTLPQPIQQIILKCLMKASSRYKTATELKKALLHYCSTKTAPFTGFWTAPKALVATAAVAIGVYVAVQQPPLAPAPVVPTPPPIAMVDPPIRIVEHNEKPLNEKELGILAKYNIVVLLDRSGSMRSADCGSTNTSSTVARGSSRWDWTENELESLSKQSEKILPNGFDVITWNDLPELYENCKVDQIAQIYKEHPPGGGNNLGKALTEAFKLKFPTQKPLLAAIVTDGDPSDLVPSESAIVEKLGGEKAGATKVVFLRVGGNDIRGEEMLRDLDDYFKQKLPDNPSVHTVNFPEVAEKGLGRALENSVENDKK
jgi:hypothetical protein